MRWLLPVLLVSSIAQAQQPPPCRPTSIGFACPGDLICDTKVEQCVPRVQTRIPCQQAPSGFICPGDLICNGKLLCVAPPHYPRAQSASMRNSGIVLTLIGSGLVVTAIAFFAQSHSCPAPLEIFGPRADDDCKAGYSFAGVSVFFFGLGIPLWAIGQHWLNRYPERAELFITPVDGGALAGVRLISF